ncbi:hypothetical protein HDU84_002500 [Entophlyctis sp. JEL0112]|nr:hypothetical protein HDU84_002500 [Entophlyctis sp. JEL0112]
MTITAVIKFGGASITHKSSGTFDLNYRVIESSVLQIAAARKIIGQGLQVLLVCGVGPFGHVNVVRHNIANGVFSANQKVGAAITKEACDAVGFAVTNAAVSAGLQAVYVPAHTIARKRGGKAFDKFDHDVFRQLMNEGSMPVTTGTMVEDCEIGFAVLSGDEIVAQLSELLDPERILLGSDVDGIFTADPSVNPNARLISAIDTSNLKLVLQESVTGSKAVDVTGGMRGKLEQLSHSIGKRVAFVFRLGAAEFALNTLGKRTKPNTAELPSMVQFGVFQLRQLPATISAGSVLQCWVEMYILAVKGVKAEDDLTIELVCVASCKTSNNIEAVEEVWPKGRVSRVLAPYKENGQIKVFGQGNHSYIVQFEVPEDCFPSVENACASQNGVNAEFDISYVIRCTFPSRDNSFSLDQPVTVVQPPLPSLMLSPLDAPYKSDVPTVLIEIIQKLSLPNFSYKLSASQDRPAEATAGVPFESVVATFPMPSVPANSVSNYTVTLSPIPYMAPSMYLGPIDVDYAIRIVAVFPPTVAGANQLVEVLATTNINLLPKSQELEIDLQFDTVDKTLPTDGTANSVPIIEVAPWSPLVNPQFNQPPVSLPGPLAFQSAPLAQFPVHPQSGNFPASPPQFHAPLSTPLNAPAQSVSVIPQQVALPPTANVLVPKFSHSQSLHDQEHDSRVVSQHHPPGSIEARLKKMEAQRDVLPVDSTPLPVYSEAAPPFQPLPQIAYANQSNLPPVSEAVTSVVSAIITPDHQRMKMQQEELERIKFEREKLAAEAEQLREQERLRHQALLEEARRRKEEALEAERAKAEEKKRMEIERVMEENRRLEAEKLALEEAERLRAEQERKRIEEEERRKAEEEARRIESERKKAEELERLRLEAEAKRIEEERLKAEEIKRVEDEKRRAEDERIEALRQKTNEARRQLELGKQELEEQERLRELESQLEELRLQKQIQAEKSAAAKALEDQRRQTEVDKLKRDAELQAEKLKLQAELEFTKERAENDRLREEVERLKAQHQKHQSVQYGNIGSSSSHPVSRSQEKMNPLEFGDDEDVEPLQQRRQGGQFYKTVGLVREKTKHAAVAGAVVSGASSSGRLEQQSRAAPTGSDFSVPLAAPVKPQGSSASSYTPATSSPTEAQMKIAYDAALDSYRNRLFTHVGISGRPLTGREQTVARNDELMSAAKHLGGGSKSTAMMSALEAEMRVIESEILEDYENGLFLQMKEKILNCKETLRAMFDAGLINSTKELNEECKTALEGIKIDGDVSGRAYERAKATFEETVKAPLTKLMAQRELGNNGANAGFSSHKCSRRDCSNPKAVGRDFCSRNCETLAARGMIRQAYYESIKQATTNWLGEYLRITGASSGDDPSHDLPYDSILHVIIIPNYCETTDTLCETLDVLASHRRALTQYRVIAAMIYIACVSYDILQVCLAMEESEKGCVTKAQMLLKVYSDSFFDITYTVHPANLPGEIRGKSSNVAWAAREMAKYRTVPANIAAVAVEKMYHERIHGVNCGYESVELSNDLPGQHSHEVITVLDCDSIFAEDYFAALACHYATASPEQRKIMMFMPSTVFDRWVLA